MHAGTLRPKLAVGALNDPAESHADHLAKQVMAEDTPCACSGSGTSCPKCQTATFDTAIRRKPAGDGASAAAAGNLQLRSGRRLGDSERSFFERRMDMDLSAVRVHDDKHAATAAKQINARAFTVGNNIAFAEGAYQPHSNSGRELIAHELAHVMQNAPVIRRAPDGGQLDPTNEAAWDWYDSESHRKNFGFLNTVNAAGESAKGLETQLKGSAKPTTDDEREAFDAKVRMLIKLRAISMVGQHRAELLQREKQFEAMVSDSEPAPDGGPSTKRQDFLTAVRASSEAVNELRAQKSKLDESRETAMSTVRVNGGPETLDDEWTELRNAASGNSTAVMFQRVIDVRKYVKGGRHWGSKKDMLMTLGREIRDLRVKQIRGIDASIALTYNTFPFLGDLRSEWITSGKQKDSHKYMKVLGLGASVFSGSPLVALGLGLDLLKKDKAPDNDQLVEGIRDSYNKLLTKTDESIVEIGTGDIHPFDLPGAVGAVRASLPPDLQAELDQLIKDREARQFAYEMIIALGLAVLTGLTGGLAGIGLAGWAAAAGGVAATTGVIQAAVQIEDLLDKQTLADASTNPDGSLIGVSAPSMFEWTMAGVGLVLSVADLGAVAKEISAIKPKFNEPPHLPDAHPNPKAAGELNSPEPTGGEPHVTEPHSDAPAAHPGEPNTHPDAPTAHPGVPSENPEALQAQNAAQKKVVDSGVGDAVPTIEQAEAELAIVEEAKPKKIPGKIFKEEVSLENKHTWRHNTAEDMWCRFSDGRVCIPGRRGKARTTVSSTTDLDRVEAMSRPNINEPPASVVTNTDITMWELYCYYYEERLANMRLDLKELNATKRDLPRTFESFRETWANSNALPALKGRVAQMRLSTEANNIVSEGKVGGNIAISDVPNPGKNEIVRPDLMWKRNSGNYTGVSTKQHDFVNMSRADVDKVVIKDTNEVLNKYHGDKWVRTPGTEVSGKQITINEVYLNFDPRGIPDELQAHVFAVATEAAEARGVHLEVTFFEIGGFDNFR